MHTQFIYKIRGLLNDSSVLNGVLFSAFSFFNQGINFFLLLILANYIIPSDYGLLSLFNTFVLLIGYFVVLSTQGYLSISYFKKKDNNEFRKDVSSIFFISICYILIGIILLTIYSETLSIWIKIPSNLLWIALFISACNTYIHIGLDYFRIQKKIISYGIISCGFALSNLIITFIFIIGYNWNWVARPISQLISCVIFTLIIFAYLLKAKIFHKNFFSLNRFKTIFLWGLPLIPHQLVTWLKQGGDRYIIDYYYTLEDVGIFSFAINLSNILIVAGQAFNASYSVDIYKILSQSKRNIETRKLLNRKINNLKYIYISIFIILLLSCWIFVPYIFPKYINSINYFSILLVGALFNCLYFLYCNYLFYYEKNKTIMNITVFTSIIHFSLSLLLTKYSLYYTAIIYTLVMGYMYYRIKVKALQIIND